MGTIENKDTIRRIYQALQTGDRSVFSASVHPDYVWRFPATAAGRNASPDRTRCAPNC